MTVMINYAPRWSHARGNTVVPSRWQATGVFGGQRVGGLRGQRRGVETRDLAEGGDDVVDHAADTDGGVGQVDDHVPGGVQAGGGGADGDGFPGADLAGDD